MKLKACADKVLKVRSKPQVHTLWPARFGGPQIVPPVHWASDVQGTPALPAAQRATFANRVLLICWNRWSYTTQPVSAGLAPVFTLAVLGSTLPPSTVTQTWIPISAVAVLTVAESFVSVNSPVTIDGVINSVTPLPFDVLMVVSSSAQDVPLTVGVHSGLNVPVLELRTQTVGSTAASKLPLLWAKAAPAAIASVTASARLRIYDPCLIVCLLCSAVLPSQEPQFQHE